MILYNTTFVYDKRLRQELFDWIRDTWLPQAVQSSMEMPLCAHVPAAQDNALSIAVQGRFANDSDARYWHTNAGAGLLEQLFSKYGERILAFSTSMEVFEP